MRPPLVVAIVLILPLAGADASFEWVLVKPFALATGMLTPDGSKVVVQWTNSEGYFIDVQSAATGERLFRNALHRPDLGPVVLDATDNGVIAMFDWSGEVDVLTIYNAATPETPILQQPAPQGFFSGRLGPDSATLLTISEVVMDGARSVELRSISVPGGDVLWSARTSLSGNIVRAAVAPAAERVLIHSGQEAILLGAGGELFRTRMTGVINCCIGQQVDITPDGQTLLVSDHVGAGLVKLYRERAGALELEWATSTGKERIDHVRFAPDGAHFGVASRPTFSSTSVGDVMVPVEAQIALYSVSLPIPVWTTTVTTFGFTAFDVSSDGSVVFGGHGPEPRAVVGMLNGADGALIATLGEDDGWGRASKVDIDPAGRAALVIGARLARAVPSDDAKWGVLSVERPPETVTS